MFFIDVSHQFQRLFPIDRKGIVGCRNGFQPNLSRLPVHPFPIDNVWVISFSLFLYLMKSDFISCAWPKKKFACYFFPFHKNKYQGHYECKDQYRNQNYHRHLSFLQTPDLTGFLPFSDPERRDLLAPGLPYEHEPQARDDIGGRSDKESVHASFFSFLDFSLFDC